MEAEEMQTGLSCEKGGESMAAYYDRDTYYDRGRRTQAYATENPCYDRGRGTQAYATEDTYYDRVRRTQAYAADIGAGEESCQSSLRRASLKAGGARRIARGCDNSNLPAERGIKAMGRSGGAGFASGAMKRYNKLVKSITQVPPGKSCSICR